MGRSIRVDDDGVVLRGIAVPYGEPALVLEHDNIVQELFDEESIVSLPVGAPLLVSHQRNAAPVGRVVAAEQRSYGLAVEAKLVDTDAELDRWRHRFAAGLMGSLSVGFSTSGRQVWSRPTRPGDPPTVTRRGVQVVEVSLVNWPAYDGARVHALAARTAGTEAAVRMVEELQVEMAQWSARRRSA